MKNYDEEGAEQMDEDIKKMKEGAEEIGTKQM